VSNEMVTNPTGHRPWPAPSPSAEWWRGETTATPVPPPLPDNTQDQEHDLVRGTERSANFTVRPMPETDITTANALVPVVGTHSAAAAKERATEPTPEPVPVDGFPLWPDATAAGAPVETPVSHARPDKPYKRESLDEWPPPGMRASLQTRASATIVAPRRPDKPARDRPLRHLRRPGTGLAWLVFVALLAGFFAWTSAEPFWLAVGHSKAGTATVTRCAGDGVLRRCIATFTGAGFTAEEVTLLGAQPDREKVEGAEVPARMVRPGDRVAYAGSTDRLHLRWGAGLGLILVCGMLITWITGARRLLGRQARIGAVLLSFAGPVLLFVGMLAAAF
jgi:hypothetical protein